MLLCCETTNFSNGFVKANQLFVFNYSGHTIKGLSNNSDDTNSQLYQISFGTAYPTACLALYTLIHSSSAL